MAQRTAITPHVVRILRSRIAKGVYTKKLPGERVLAEELGVNPKTVQNALIHLEAIGLLRRRTRSGTYVVPSGERPGEGAAMLYARLAVKSPINVLGETDFWSSLIIFGFQRAAQTRGISMALEYTDSAEDVVREALAESAAPGCAGTCILAIPIETRHALRLAASPGAVVLADWDLEEPILPTLNIDNLGAGRVVAEHLVGLGHRRIAFANAEPVSPAGRARLKGVQDFLSEAGMRLTRVEIYRSDHHAAFDRVLSDSPAPTAVISGSPRAAEIFVELAAGRGVAVPADLSLAAFGEPRMFQRRPVTLAAGDHETLGRRAFEMLLDEEVRADPRRVLLPVRLIEGGTTAPPRT